MFDIKKNLAKITEQLNMKPQIKKWSNIATPEKQYYTCATFTLKPNSKYLILARSGNGSGTAIVSACNFVQSSGKAVSIVDGSSVNAAGSGNYAVGWYYVETGSQSSTVLVRGYGYDSTVTNLNGAAIAFRLVGGYCVALRRLFARRSAIGKAVV